MSFKCPFCLTRVPCLPGHGCRKRRPSDTRQGAAGREYWDYRSSLWLRPKEAEFDAVVSSVVILHRLKRGWNLSDACLVPRSARRGDPPPTVETEWRDLLGELQAAKKSRNILTTRNLVTENLTRFPRRQILIDARAKVETERELETIRLLMPEHFELLSRLGLVEAPRTVGDCESAGLGLAQNPCPWMRCKYNMLLWVRAKSITYERANQRDETGAPILTAHPETCALRAADRGSLSPIKVATLISRTRQGVDVIERKALLKLKLNPPEALLEAV